MTVFDFGHLSWENLKALEAVLIKRTSDADPTPAFIPNLERLALKFENCGAFQEYAPGPTTKLDSIPIFLDIAEYRSGLGTPNATRGFCLTEIRAGCCLGQDAKTLNSEGYTDRVQQLVDRGFDLTMTAVEHAHFWLYWYM